MSEIALKAIALVRSTLMECTDAPLQPDEGAPSAWLDVLPKSAAGITNLRCDDEILILTWLHLADRSVLSVHPRGDLSRHTKGVFSTRSQHRPNPIGVHRAKIIGIHNSSIQVESLEAINGTPVLDIKPLLNSDLELR